jgi:AcrR family transcriptional regulator
MALILDAAVDTLGDDPAVSMSAIARRAGVTRATVYEHFATRDALLEAVTDRALAEVGAVIAAAEPERGEPKEAMRRVVTAAWRQLGRYHALVAVNTTTQAPEQLRKRHLPVLGRLLPLVERGQTAGAFNPGVPAVWHLSMLLAVIHTASAEFRNGRVEERDAEAAVVSSVIGALAGDTT